MRVAQTRIVVAGIDDRNVGGQFLEEVLRQVFNGEKRNGKNDKVRAADGFFCVRSNDSNLVGEWPDGIYALGVRHPDLMARRCKLSGESAANIADSDDADFHADAPVVLPIKIMKTAIWTRTNR